MMVILQVGEHIGRDNSNLERLKNVKRTLHVITF